LVRKKTKEKKGTFFLKRKTMKHAERKKGAAGDFFGNLSKKKRFSWSFFIHVQIFFQNFRLPAKIFSHVKTM